MTQQFNTTTSMGRLTLNMLLSFAQFEREIAGERIRDKIAASKRKGMWMGGNVPLGYDVKDRKLIVNEPEASTVRLIFKRYAELGSVALLKAELDRLGIVSKRREGDGKIDWTSAAKDALLWVPAGGHGHPVKHLGLASRCAGLWVVRASIPAPRTNGAQTHVVPFPREVPEPQERRTQEGERQIERDSSAQGPVHRGHPQETDAIC